MPKAALFLLLTLLLAVFVYLGRSSLFPLLFTPRSVSTSTGVISKVSPASEKDLSIVAENLSVPWEIAFLPGGDLLVTERSGKLLRVGAQTKLIKEIEGVRQIGEGGLLGLALHPKFADNRFIYLYLTTGEKGNLTNRVERYKLTGDSLSDKKIILDGIKGSANHDGGRIAFGPDGFLYVATGDGEVTANAQDKSSLNGKILRLKDDGTIPSDNPFGNATYSLGHRNPQGLAWDKSGSLWISEHGPSGAQTGYDEINLIVKGGNYGWPEVKGDQVKDGFISPVIESGSADTWAPSGMVYWDGSLFFSGLRGEALYEAKILPGNKLKLLTHYKKEFGRLRAVTLSPDGFLYISTSNNDGRGKPKSGDDKIIKINPQIFR